MPEADAIDKKVKPINQQCLADLIINAEDLITHEETQQMAKVLCRNIDSNGNVIGNFDENPVLNLLVYDVEFPDGAVKHYAANVIDENVLCQVDFSGFYTQAISWMSLKLLKESNHIEVAEYATNLGLETGPAFLWWMSYTLKKRDHIISVVNTRVRKCNDNIGIKIPNNIKVAIFLDKSNGNTM